MQIDFTLEPNESMNNFTLAGVIYEYCKDSYGPRLDAKVVAEMLLAQIENEEDEDDHPES